MVSSSAPRTAAAREADLTKTADLYIQGKTQQEIADTIGVSRTTIKSDIAELITRWRAYTTLAFDEHVARELLRIDAIERAAWEGWHISMRPATEISDEDTTTGVGKRATRRRARRQVSKQRVPDNKFLQTIHACVQERVKILGLAAPEQIQARIIRGEAEPANVRQLEVYRNAAKDPAKARMLIALADGLAGAPPSRYPDDPAEYDQMDA
jgi:hypothetical protein